ncbi:hypothetical protein OVA07_14155 [Novosphingobium sp. SL115]|uniref:hypothetical protein n=1 Tax=Novosphingobium sp. SL115 TaxID=2995150 RepID=UPI002276BD05|nr:hypothetical protein [Novosphingobium sp. SL115]MCY1672147.1 hypothetical protein [Novosphingobium sp. SL115]
MTFVVARKFGERILILSDTMITHHPDQRKNDIIPGQLKGIVLNLDMSVAFCGNVVRALDAIREAKARIRQGGSREDVIRILRSCSLKNCDFILASHSGGASLIKITGGSVSAPQDAHWLGNRHILARIQRQQAISDKGFENVLRSNAGLTDTRTEEGTFIGLFSQVLLSDPMTAEDVGGFATNLLASPFGHCYQMTAGAYAPGPITIGGPDHGQEQLPGNRYAYNFISPSYRGVSIAGIFMDEPRVGYIYDPLLCDEAIKVPNITLQAMHEIVNERAKAAGGKPEAEC